jgi:hypothetical protein
MEKFSTKRFIWKVIPGCIGPLLLILWAVVSWIQKEAQMDFFRWSFVIIVVLSTGYGVYEFIAFLYRLWKQSYNHDHKVDFDKLESGFKKNLDSLQNEVRGYVNNASENHQFILTRMSKLEGNIAAKISDSQEKALEGDRQIHKSISEWMEEIRKEFQRKEGAFEQKVNQIIDARFAKEKQEAEWEGQRRDRRIAGIPKADDWPKTNEK